MPQDPKALTRAQMEEVIKRGGSVCHKGQIYNKVEQLPAVDMLVESEAEKQDELSKLEAEEAALKKRREALEARKFDESDPKEEDEFTKLAAKADAEKAAEDKKGDKPKK